MRNTSTTRDFFNQKKDKGNEEKWRPVSDSFTQHAGSYVRWTCLLCLDCMLWLLYRQYCELAAGLSYVCFHLPRCSHVKLRSTWLHSPADKKKKKLPSQCAFLSFASVGRSAKQVKTVSQEKEAESLNIDNVGEGVHFTTVCKHS